MPKRIYSFGADLTEGDKSLALLLGGKGANLAEMTRFGVPVPPGFTISTGVCAEFYRLGKKLPEDLFSEVEEAVSRVEKAVGRRFGDKNDPLLFSVRSGAPVSMPGMMDTVLNLGLTHDSVRGLAKISGNDRFAWDTYRRLLQMFGDVVLGCQSEDFEHALTAVKKERGVKLDADLPADALQGLVDSYESIIKKQTGSPFPQDPKKQLALSIQAVFSSWHTPRAVTYRKISNISEDLGTAVTVQTMVFGNRGPTSATGVLFTRDPSTGVPGIMGEYLINAQGEDVVAGTRTPSPMNKQSRSAQSVGASLEEWRPEIYQQIVDVTRALEKHYRDMQDIEFTIEEGKLWILQTRNGKRTAHSAVRIAVDMVTEGIVDRRKALLQVKPSQLDQLLHPIFDPSAKRDSLAKGLPASPGAVSGKIVFTAEDAETWAARGEKVLLVRQETSPEDIHGMHASLGIITSRGGMTSHAAVVARGMGKTCVVGCDGIDVRPKEKCLITTSGEKIPEGTLLSLDGSTGELLRGELATVEPQIGTYFATLMTWADEFRTLKVRANADTPHDCQVARNFGCEGVGLCRTEHMFFDKTRIDIVRQMILSESVEERNKYLDLIMPMQLEDFRGIFKVMRGLPVTIRLLDPPLHEFLPHTKEEIEQLAKRIGVSPKDLSARIESLHEANPMLGHRGCRLGITFPEIYDMQVRAIMTAACQNAAETREKVYPEIMIPLIVDPKELQVLRARTVKIAEEIKAKFKVDVHYLVGTMIEIPRAALLAHEIALHADFFSFGTNDLTQMTYGLSRDDSSRFLPKYIEAEVFENDPFSTIDPAGVMQLVRMGTENGRRAKPSLKVGICGEHGGDPASIEHFAAAGLDYVSCSPFRVPLARLTAAQIVLKAPGVHK